MKSLFWLTLVAGKATLALRISKLTEGRVQRLEHENSDLRFQVELLSNQVEKLTRMVSDGQQVIYEKRVWSLKDATPSIN